MSIDTELGMLQSRLHFIHSLLPTQDDLFPIQPQPTMLKVLGRDIAYSLRLPDRQSTTGPLLPPTNTLGMIRDGRPLRPNHIQRMAQILLQQRRQLCLKRTLLHKRLCNAKILDQQREAKPGVEIPRQGVAPERVHGREVDAGADVQHVDHLLRVEAEFLARHQRVRQRAYGRGHDVVVERLHRVAGAQRAHVEDVAGHALEDGLDGGEVGLVVAANHQRRLSRVGGVHVCLCDGAVYEVQSMLGQVFAEGLRVERRRGRRVDDDCS